MEKITLQQILEAFCAPINEEQAWAVCYQCAKYLQSPLSQLIPSLRQGTASASPQKSPKNDQCESRQVGHVFALSDVSLSSDGNVVVTITKTNSRAQEKMIIQSLGVLVFQALDYGLNDTEEQKLSTPLENLIGRMTGDGEVPQDGDEGIVEDDKSEMCLEDVIQECTKHFGKGVDVRGHCKAVCRALVHEAGELVMFLERVVSENERIKDLCGQLDVADESQLSTLQRRDWARLWMQVIKELRQGVKLKKVRQSTSTHPVEYELTPYEILMDDVRCKRYTLNKVEKCEDAYPTRVKKDVHEIILEFIRSRPPLQSVNKRILSSPLEKSSDPRERLLHDIRTIKPQLRPTPRRMLENARMSSVDHHSNQAKKVIKPDLSLLSFNMSDNEFDSTFDKRVDSDEDKNKVSVLNLVPLTPLSPKSPPKHLPWQHTENAEEAHKIESNVATTSSSSSSSSAFFPSSSSSSSSKTSLAPNRRDVIGPGSWAKNNSIDFRDFNMASTIECLSLTVEEVMHIRGVLTKAELECTSVNPELHSLLESGKVCFSCKKVKFSIFGPWPTKCKFCCRNVCSQCSSKMRIPTEHFEHIPVYTLNPSPSSPMNSMDAHSMDASLTGSAPSSPERELPVLSARRESKELEEKQGFHRNSSLDKSGRTPASRSQRLVEGPSPASRNIFQRSQTIRPFSAAVGHSSTSFKSRILEAGPLMNVCSDCRSMVVGIIRASRRCLALIGHRGAHGRAERAYSACPSSRRSFASPGSMEGAPPATATRPRRSNE